MRIVALLVLMFFTSFQIYSQSVGIGTQNPHPSALLDISSTSKGILIPRITSTTIISSPAQGLLIYQTEQPSGFYYYDGVKWVSAFSNDNLGNHIAEKALNMKSFNIVGIDSLITFEAKIGANSYPSDKGLKNQVLLTDGEGHLSWGNFSTTGDPRYIGEVFGGGVVFHVYKDASGVQHGLIVSIAPQSVESVWSIPSNILVGTASQSTWDGFSNTSEILNNSLILTSAANLANNFNKEENQNWYLPSIDEMHLLQKVRYQVNKALSKIEFSVPLGLHSYWSSTENSFKTAKILNMNDGVTTNSNKDNKYYVRAIRSF